MAGAAPFYYGWIVLAAAALSSYSARPLMAATTLSVFVVPMTEELGWSRGLFSGALSLGGLVAVAASPVVGRLIDRHGSGAVVAAASALMGLCAVGLSAVSQAWTFYALYIPGRMLFASPLELGTATAVSNWFVRRRSLTLAILGASQGTGLAAMPPVVQVLISGWNWQTAWLALGVYTICVGVVPSLMMARRPEDLGLEVDPAPAPPPGREIGPSGLPQPRQTVAMEPNFTLGEAFRTRAFWLLAAFSAAVFMAQGGVALHQAAHYINEGLGPGAAVVMPSTFALSQVIGGFLWSGLAGRIPLRTVISLAGLSVALGVAGTGASSTLGWGIPAAAAFGVGIGGAHLLLRLAWADYYGRLHLGSIRGVTLSAQIGGQMVGPVIAGLAFDASGDYSTAFFGLGAMVALASVVALAAVPPRREPKVF